MAGIYIHIPFCRKACNYCDFHFSTQLKVKDEMVRAILGELEMRKDYLGDKEIETIYFGGGTPSLLSQTNLEDIFTGIYKNFRVSNMPEITLEANPDDLNKESIRKFKNTPINRFSIGIQSFFEEDLVWMNRSHNAKQSLQSINELQNSGYPNLSLDLIFGFSLLSQKKWEENIQTALHLQVPHISTYGMTIEKGTLLGNQAEKGKYQEIEEEIYADQYLYLMETLENAGLDQYEISNFSKPGFHSRHNSNYWNRIPYLGIGPSAHSFNGISRSWNISNNSSYIKGIMEHSRKFEEETLTPDNHFDEYILTSIRTRKGVEIPFLESQFGREKSINFIKKANLINQDGLLDIHTNYIALTKKGRMVSDLLIQKLF